MLDPPHWFSGGSRTPRQMTFMAARNRKPEWGEGLPRPNVLAKSQNNGKIMEYDYYDIFSWNIT